MTHTFRSKLPLAHREKIDVTVFDWTAGSVPYQLKGENKLLVRVLGSLKLIITAVTLSEVVAYL